MATRTRPDTDIHPWPRSDERTWAAVDSGLGGSRPRADCCTPPSQDENAGQRRTTEESACTPGNLVESFFAMIDERRIASLTSPYSVDPSWPQRAFSGQVADTEPFPV